MSEQNFDQHLRDNLDDYRSPLDTDALWKTLEPQLAETNKRRKAIIWWWSGAGLLLLAVAAWGWYASNGAPSKPAELAAAKDANRNIPHIAPQESAQPSTTANANAQVTAPANTAEKTASTIVSEESEEVRANVTTAKVAEAAKKSVAKKQAPADATAKANALKNFLPQAASPKQITTSNALPPVAESNTPASTETPNTTEEQPAPIAPSTETMNNLDFLATLSPSLFATNAAPALSPIAVARRKSKSSTVFFRSDFGLGKTATTLGLKNPADSLAILDEPHLNARRATERALEYWQAQVLGGVKHRSGLYVLSGLSYTHINESFTFSSTRTERDTLENGILEIYINASGDSVITRGPVPFTRYISYNKRTFNSYRLADVPLVAGFQLGEGRWSLGVEGGVFINFALRTEGEILDEFNNIIKLEDANVFKPSIGLSYYGSLRLGYKIDDGAQIAIAPSFRVLPDMTQDGYRLSQKHTLTGLNLSLVYLLR